MIVEYDGGLHARPTPRPSRCSTSCNRYPEALRGVTVFAIEVDGDDALGRHDRPRVRAVRDARRDGKAVRPSLAVAVDVLERHSAEARLAAVDSSAHV